MKGSPTLIRWPIRTEIPPAIRARRAGGGRACWAVLLAGAIVGGILSGPAAAAEPSPSDALFREGKELMAAGRTAEACEKFARSLELAKRGGTLLNLAVCREAEGRFATALALLDEARAIAASDGRPDRIALIDEHAAIIRPKLSTLVVAPPDGAPTAGLTIELDGADLPVERWGQARPIDPGTHAVRASAPGRVPYAGEVTVGAVGDHATLPIPPLAVVPPPPPRPAPPPTVTSPPPAALAVAPLAASAPAPGAVKTARRGRALGWAGVAAGAAAVAVGGLFGVKAIDDAASSRRACPDTSCAAGPYQQNQDARAEARIADVTVGAGVALAAAGLYLLLRSPREPAPRRTASGPPRLWLSPQPGGAALGLGEAW
jgi:hypothetical protein